MRRLICTFVVRIWHKQFFSWRGSYITLYCPLLSYTVCHCKYHCGANGEGKFRLCLCLIHVSLYYMDCVKRIWYLSPMRAAKVQGSLRIHAVSPEPSLLAHTSSESRGTFRQKARSLAPLNVWACAVKICHDGMLEDTNSLDGAHMLTEISNK